MKLRLILLNDLFYRGTGPKGDTGPQDDKGEKRDSGPSKAFTSFCSADYSGNLTKDQKIPFSNQALGTQSDISHLEDATDFELLPDHKYFVDIFVSGTTKVGEKMAISLQIDDADYESFYCGKDGSFNVTNGFAYIITNNNYGKKVSIKTNTDLTEATATIHVIQLDKKKTF